MWAGFWAGFPQLELCPLELEDPLEMPLELEPASSEPSLLLELELELERALLPTCSELGPSLLLLLELELEPSFWKLAATGCFPPDDALILPL